MVTPSSDQQAPGYATLTIESVTVESGFEASGEFTNNFVVRDDSGNRAFNTKVVDIPLELQKREDFEDRYVPKNEDTEVFAIGIHSIYDTPVTVSEEERPEVGVGSGQLEKSFEFDPSPRGDGSSLIGLKILETGTHTDVDVPIYPIAGLTDLSLVDVIPEEFEEPEPLTFPQQFPPVGGDDGTPSVQAAVYNEFVFMSELPPVAARSAVVDVTDGLNPDEQPRLILKGDDSLEREEEGDLEDPIIAG